MANWYVDNPVTFDSTSEADLNGTVKDLYIKPVDFDGTYQEVYLDKSNFKIGNATETDGSGSATAGTNIWEGGNVDIGITKVEFINTLEGDPNNHVIARVTFGSVSPVSSKTFFIDIDEKDDNPVATVISQNVCFFVNVPYDTNYRHEFYTPESASGNWTLQADDAVAGGNITRTLINTNSVATDGHYRYKFSGAIQDYDPVALYDITKILFRRSANSSVIIDPLPGDGVVDMETNNYFFHTALSNLFANNSSTSTFFLDVETNSTFFNNIDGTNSTGTSNNFAVAVDISVDPQEEDMPSNPAWHTINGICSLGNTIDLQVKYFNPIFPGNDADSEDDTPGGPNAVIRSVAATYSPRSTGGSKQIIVRGDEGAKYKLWYYKTTSLTDSTAASGNSYYTTAGGGTFTSTTPGIENVATIGFQKRVVHKINVPSSTSDCRYELYIEPLDSTLAADGVPIITNKKAIYQSGVRSITLNCAVETANNWDTLPTFSFTRPSREDVGGSSHKSTTSIVRTSISSKSRVVLEESNRNIETGMFVIHPFDADRGVPHLTTVKSVSGNIITLSAACTLTAGDLLLFERNSTSIVPYTLEIKAGTGSDSDYQNMSIASSYSPSNCISGLSDRVVCTLNAPVSNSKAIVCTAASPVSEVAVGMFLKTNQDSTISSKVTAVTLSTNTITVEDDVTIPDAKAIYFEADQALETQVTTTGIKNLHTQADMTKDGVATAGGTVANDHQEIAVISGYFLVGNVRNTATITVKVDNLLQSVEP